MLEIKVNSERWLNPDKFSREIWKKVAALPDTYRVSNFGRVKRKEGRYYKILYSTNNGRDYYTIPVGHKKFYIHRLVALAFIPNPNSYPEIDHINGKKDDNRAKNLRWVTRGMNMANPTTRQKRIVSCKWIPVEQVDKKGIVTKKWDNLAEAAREIGVHKTTLKKAIGIFGWVGDYRYRAAT